MVLVYPPDPAWPRLFESEATLLRSTLSGSNPEIHHIGSTAVPGMHAKPVIDILIVVSDVASLDASAARLEVAGYAAMGEYGIPGRRYFRKAIAGHRTHHIHAFRNGAPEVVRHLAFRDYLRAHPDVARAYADLKCRLAQDFPDDGRAYTDGKSAFIRRILQASLGYPAEV